MAQGEAAVDAVDAVPESRHGAHAIVVGRLNRGARVDFVLQVGLRWVCVLGGSALRANGAGSTTLQENPLEVINEQLFSLQAHSSYWCVVGGCRQGAWPDAAAAWQDVRGHGLVCIAPLVPRFVLKNTRVHAHSQQLLYMGRWPLRPPPCPRVTTRHAPPRPTRIPPRPPTSLPPHCPA